MNSKPFISVITISYNDKKGLEKTIDSLASQTFPDYEHIIVDGGSNDGSRELIESKLQNKDYAQHVTYWCSEKDDGIYPAMNKGIEHANGTYCLMLNSGDYLANSKVLQKAASYNFTEDIVYCDAYFVRRWSTRRISYPKKITGSFFFLRGFCHQSTFIKTSLQKANLYSYEYKIVNDSDFFMKVILQQNCSARHIPLALTYYDAVSGFSSASESAHNKEYSMLLDKYYSPRVQEDLRAILKYRYWPLLTFRAIKKLIRKIINR
ncbi:MAG: glycosyltransferase [Treponema sp.]|nr:glycosyltransferase [Treponema sp.]